ncbi:MAG: response regulator [candidate division KSB1 bacterium]|nr:response regulator [candidate division KSB1 bacterium]
MADKGYVLLVDDDANMALIAQRVFTRAGFRFASVETGQDAFEFLRRERPDLVMLDYMLPDMNGEEFLREYQKLGPDRPPVVMLTCRADKNDRIEEYFQLGLSAFLVKPFGNRELVAVAENLIQRARLERRERVQGAGPGGDQSLPREVVKDLILTVQSLEALAYSLLSGGDGELMERQRVTVGAIYNGCRRLEKALRELVERAEPHLQATTRTEDMEPRR